MSEFFKVTDLISVAPQISMSDIDRAAAGGIKLIINNRPDGEEAGQPSNESLAAYAAGKGLKWAAIPVNSGQLTFEAIESMSFALRDAEGPVLAYCRSGTRSCTLWALAQAFTKARDVSEIVTLASGAGYDISGMVPTLEHLHSIAKS